MPTPIPDAAQWAEKFFRRHPALKNFARGVRFKNKEIGGSLHGEARQHGNEIWLSQKFWKLDAKTRDFVLAHEIGHYVMDEYGSAKLIEAASKLGLDLWKTDELPFSQFNMGEAFADSFATWALNPSELKHRYPLWAELVKRVGTGSVKIAAEVTLDFSWVAKMRKDFLTLMKNIPRVDSYAKGAVLRDAFKTYRKNFDEIVFKRFVNQDLYGLEENPYVNRPGLEKREIEYIEKKLRKTGWDFSIELRLPLGYPDEYNSEAVVLQRYKNEARRWEARLRRKAQIFWKELKETIDWYNKFGRKPEGQAPDFPVTVPDRDRVTLEGFSTIIEGYDPSSETDVDALAKVREGLRLYRKRAAQVLPLLLQKQLPIIVDFKAGLDVGGRYERSHIILNPLGHITDKNPNIVAHVLAHEMGHHLFKMLPGDAEKFWYAAIRSDYGDLDVRDLLARWPASIEWSMDFVDEMATKDPILALQVDVLGYGHQNRTRFDKREDFQHALDAGETTLRVPKSPITGYAGKNAEEAFCEAIGRLVGFGPRTVLPIIRHWLDIVLPGQVKAAAAARVLARYLERRAMV